jgi:Uma2 family endonuclease
MSMPLERESYTYEDYAKWPEGARVELIDGVAYNMSAASNRLHQRVLGKLHRLIGNYLDGKTCEVYIAPFDVRLPEASKRDADIRAVVQPDLSVICDPSKLDERGCLGAPDLIVEIISPGSFRQDMARKLALYERVGVREYWIVFPVEKIVQVYVLGEHGKYGSFESYTVEDMLTVGIMPELTIAVETIFAV